MTAKLILYHDTNCPYSRKALIMASEHGLGDIFEFVSPYSAIGQQSIVQDTPLSKMPALVIAPGLAIFNSRVICRYVDWLREDQPSFYPEEGLKLWLALRHELLGDGMIDAGIAARQELSRPRKHQMPERIERQMAKIHAGLDCLAKELDQLEGPLTVGTIAVSNALSHLDFRWAHLNWRAKRPALAAWWAALEARPAFAAHSFNELALRLKKLAGAR